MKNLWKLIIVVFLAVAVIAVITLKNKEQQSVPVSEPNQSAIAAKLPKLIELGADKCVPCKMMKPILDELTVEYKGKLDVICYDVWKNESYAKKYNIEIIPTQIFFRPE
jgi:thioredoxin 1